MSSPRRTSGPEKEVFLVGIHEGAASRSRWPEPWAPGFHPSSSAVAAGSLPPPASSGVLAAAPRFSGFPAPPLSQLSPGRCRGPQTRGSLRPSGWPSFLLQTVPPGRTRRACFLVRTSAHWPTGPRALPPPARPGGPATRLGQQSPRSERLAPAGEDVHVTLSRERDSSLSPPVVHTASAPFRDEAWSFRGGVCSQSRSWSGGQGHVASGRRAGSWLRRSAMTTQTPWDVHCRPFSGPAQMTDTRPALGTPAEPGTPGL